MASSSRRTFHAVHFVGIGGIGMSALARYFLKLGTHPSIRRSWIISGSDAERSAITDALRREGVTVKIGHKASNISPKTGLVIYNRAIPADNPEVKEARRRGIPAVPYADVLGEITKGHMTIAITGSHGKTTTTALTGVVLMNAKLDPTILVGSMLKELGGRNVRVGRSPCLVLEADDFGAAFLAYTPSIAVVTNVDREHLDFYKTFGAVKKAFVSFLARTIPRGVMILNADDPPLAGLRPKIERIAQAIDAKTVWYSIRNAPGTVRAPVEKIKKHLMIAGAHNLSNATAAYHVGRTLKISEKAIIRGLASYRGAWRRMEYRGRAGRAKVFDDYAHHPSELRATLAAFREKFPSSPLIAVFEPHQSKRLELLFKDFVTSFADADAVVILPTYAVKGRDRKPRVTAEDLADAIRKKFPRKPVAYLAKPGRVGRVVRETVDALPGSPVIAMLGAGTIANLTPRILDRAV
ncbi:MAG TPA: UDP-N-acetylmuramate--L-alanine ligase [Candidatus Paceibacterota bacterium]|nr:UDP-N-acetylmuramate--L-alanine ligase [Candidatus Paceibacterota bacterium]